MLSFIDGFVRQCQAALIDFYLVIEGILTGLTYTYARAWIARQLRPHAPKKRPAVRHVSRGLPRKRSGGNLNVHELSRMDRVVSGMIQGRMFLASVRCIANLRDTSTRGMRGTGTVDYYIVVGFLWMVHYVLHDPHDGRLVDTSFMLALYSASRI